MPWPRMTDEQRTMAVALLANALRKQQRRRSGEPPPDPLLPEVGQRRLRAAADDRYLQGMRDLLAVLFVNGRATADECYEAARRLSAGEE